MSAQHCPFSVYNVALYAYVFSLFCFFVFAGDITVEYLKFKLWSSNANKSAEELGHENTIQVVAMWQRGGDLSNSESSHWSSSVKFSISARMSDPIKILLYL